MIYLLGFGAAVLLAIGFVVQQHVAARTAPENHLSPRLLVRLARRPAWLGGIAAMAAGQVLGAIALREASLTVVEPLLATNVLFALPLAAAWCRCRLGRREWAGAVVLVVGLAAFVAAAGPNDPRTSPPSASAWLTSGLAIAGVAAALTFVGRRYRQGRARATLLATAAGVLYGLQDALTQVTLRHSLAPAALVREWEPWTLVATAIVGLLLVQNAYQAAPLSASLPAVTIAEPITGMALGAGLFGQDLRLTTLSMTVEAVALAWMVTGLLIVTHSPIVCGLVDVRTVVREHIPTRPAPASLATIAAPVPPRPSPPRAALPGRSV